LAVSPFGPVLCDFDVAAVIEALILASVAASHLPPELAPPVLPAVLAAVLPALGLGLVLAEVDDLVEPQAASDATATMAVIR